jgi:hypothetical protein
MANHLKITCFDPERLALSAEGCADTANLVPVRGPQWPLCGEDPLGRYLEEGR